MSETPETTIAESGLPGVVGPPSLELPDGYTYGVTRYADVILQGSFPALCSEIVHSLENFEIDYVNEIAQRGGSRAKHTARFDQSLYDQGWDKHNVVVEKRIDDETVFKARSHEIDVFKRGEDGWYPGVAVEMEWNNKDPFFHRDLNNFAGLHREGVIAVGVIVTRGPSLQKMLTACAAAGEFPKSVYGMSTTHWDKLTPMVDLGGGGECPLLLVGIDDERVKGWPAGVTP